MADTGTVHTEPQLDERVERILMKTLIMQAGLQPNFLPLYKDNREERLDRNVRIQFLEHQWTSWNREPSLCHLCAPLHFGLLQARKPISHHPSFTSLDISAKNGCPMCMLFRYSVLNAEGLDERFPRDDENKATEILKVLCEPGKEQYEFQITGKEIHDLMTKESTCSGMGYVWSTDHPRPQTHTDSSLTSTRDRPTKKLTAHLPLYTTDPTATGVCARPVTAFPSYELCKQWIEHCSKNHPRCKQSQDRLLPSRVIDVGRGGADSIEPKMVERNGPKGHYATLSHCWGGSFPLQTTRSTYAQHPRWIPFDTLPQIFRDAVTVVRELGLRFLWIDSICIVQDEREDWEVECARMDQIYENSAFTIAPPSAENANTGFLTKRRLPLAPPCAFPEDENLRLSTSR